MSKGRVSSGLIWHTGLCSCGEPILSKIPIYFVHALPGFRHSIEVLETLFTLELPKVIIGAYLECGFGIEFVLSSLY